MEQFKVDNFKKENYERKFPEFDILSENRLRTLQKKMLSNCKLSEDEDLLILTQTVSSQVRWISGKNANTSEFSLVSFLEDMAVAVGEFVYVNWHRFDTGNVDEFKLIELNNYFHDIWYPSSDDIDIFDKTCNWVLSVRHDGAVGFWETG